MVLPKYRSVVFIHGCFWHRHRGCRYTTTPVSNAAFWQEKFAANVKRDAVVRRQLRQLGWQVCVVWSCQLNHLKMDALAVQIRAGRGK
jgi:DNA mismatch endonuclease (patch repair protein)